MSVSCTVRSTEQVLRKTAVAAAAAAGALAFYAFVVEPRRLQVRRSTVEVRGLSPALSGLRIALLSDMHLGNGTSAQFIRRACRMAMAENPDLIALTGDFISAHSKHTIAAAVEAVGGLSAPLGVYAVPGNHDHVHGIGAWHRALGEHPNLTDLTRRTLGLEKTGAPFGIAGVDDFETGDPRMCNVERPVGASLMILLAHNPDHAERLRSMPRAVDLVLSGHTHAGQVRLPFVGAVRNPATRDDLYESGLTRRPWTQVYVSRGIGTVHLPVRFMARPEIAIIEVVGSAEGTARQAG